MLRYSPAEKADICTRHPRAVPHQLSDDFAAGVDGVTADDGEHEVTAHLGGEIDPNRLVYAHKPYQHRFDGVPAIRKHEKRVAAP